VPTVAVHTQPFVRLAKSVARVNGRPTLRQAFVPQPVVGASRERLRSYIDGEDQITHRPLVREVIEGLTTPLSAEDVSGLSFDRSTPRLLEPDDEENVRRRFEEAGWTDYLPIVLPTEDRVEEMLGGTSHPPDEVVGRLRPAAFREWWEFTVEKVAVNAVMAGARPEYLPVILALAASGISARSSSTTSFTGGAILSGPIRRELSMNTGIGAMGPYNHANVTIGRAWNLLCQNLQGGSAPGETYMGSQGNALGVSFAFAENEEQSPWEPLHVEHGFDPDESVVTPFMGGWYTLFGGGPRASWIQQFTNALVACDPLPRPIFVLDPLVAEAFAEMGFDTKGKLVEHLATRARVSADEYWDNREMQTLIRPLAVAGVEPYATQLKAAPDDLVQVFQPENIKIVVVGGRTQNTWRLIAGHPHRHQPMPMVSVDKWR
jgi:hypothetical protein